MKADGRRDTNPTPRLSARDGQAAFEGGRAVGLQVAGRFIRYSSNSLSIRESG